MCNIDSRATGATETGSNVFGSFGTISSCRMNAADEHPSKPVEGLVNISESCSLSE